MYCPRCATQNQDDAKFCRSCGANLSLVPQALTGNLSAPSRHGGRKKRRRDEEKQPPSIENAISSAFTGLGFLFVSIAIYFFAPAGKIWWFWMLIPGFGMLGKGIAELASLKYHQGRMTGVGQTGMPPARQTGELSPPPQSFEAPPSVTETTTRHLEPPARHPKERV